MPELTISMPAYNAGKFIEESIASVLRQKGVDFELLVIDDGSSDDTSAIVQSINDQRVRLLPNRFNRGIGFSHNRVIRESDSEFIVHVDADDLVLPGGLQKMVQRMRESPAIGQAHCYFFDIDELGRTTQEACRQRRRSFLKNRPINIDYKRDLLVRGTIINHLRIYRRAAFAVVGLFNERLRYGVDYEMALRIVDRFNIALVPEFLYCHRVYRQSITGKLTMQNLRFWWQRYGIGFRFWRNRQVGFIRHKDYNLHRLMVIGLFHLLNRGHRVEIIWKLLTQRPLFFSHFLHRCRLIAIPRLYDRLSRCLSPWTSGLGSVEKRQRNLAHRHPRIAYYMWKFPRPTLTFIERELMALHQAGMNITVIADGSDASHAEYQPADFPVVRHYLYPVDVALLARWRRYFLIKHPVRFLNLFLYIVSHRYDHHKTLREDLKVFNQALGLAGVLRREKIDLIHAVWANRCALVALVAAKLAGITYTVQARASTDLYRHSTTLGLSENLRHAAVIMTNSHYSKSTVCSILGKRDVGQVHVVYKGIDVRQFVPPSRTANRSKDIHILSVARLAEPKGLDYLIKACAILRNHGCSFHCEIVGGPENPTYMNYYVELKLLLRNLKLLDHVTMGGSAAFDRVLEKYGQADIFVLPCVIARDGARDVIPNSLIEAMAMQLPVITTGIAANSEIIENHISGIVVPDRNEQALAEAVMALIANYDLRLRLGENARKRVEERFDIHRNIDKCVRLFKGVLNQP